MKTIEQFYIGGQWVDAKARETANVINASTEEVIATIPLGTTEDIDRAVTAAREAFESWSQTPVAERARILRQIQAGLAARNEEIATTIAQEVGTPMRIAKQVQAGLPTVVMGSAADLIEKTELEEQVGNSLIVREPVGVVGSITPWNYPLHQLVAKVAPAIAAGCTVVAKPSKEAPLSAFILAEIVDQSDLPAGVFNLVSGEGRVVGEAIAAHPGVDMVSFTGSTGAGRRVSEVAAGTVKRVALELGGKSANVILDDADLQKAVRAGVANCYLNSGQTCSAWTRMLVPRTKLEEINALVREAAEAFTLADPISGQGRLGPLVSQAQRDRVRRYIQQGIDEGAELIAGGPDQPEGLDRGFFVKPTVFSNVRSDMTIAQDEIFGPVLSILPYEDEEDAIRIANDSIYGLAGAVWSSDPERAKRVARRMRTGQVDINGGAFNPLAPFGGFKQSGHGRELGKFGIEEFLEIKSLQL